jgi:hypothetical protein
MFIFRNSEPLPWLSFLGRARRTTSTTPIVMRFQRSSQRIGWNLRENSVEAHPCNPLKGEGKLNG